METVIIVIHLMVVLALIAIILVQRSEGGALGIGGGGGNMFASRGSANLLTRTTTILAIVFFATTLVLTILARQDAGGPSILDATGDGTGPAIPVGDDATRGTGEGILDVLPASPALTPDEGTTVPVPGGDGAGNQGGPSVPVSE